MNKEQKISKESAKQILDEWFDYYCIHFEDIVNEQGKESAETTANKLIRAIMSGKIETKTCEEKGFVIIQHLKDGTQVVYSEISGKNMIEGEKAKGSISGMYAMLGSLSGIGFDAIKNFKGVDLGIAHCIGTIFLVV